MNIEANLTQPKNESVNVSWSAPHYRNGIIRKYRVYYKKTTENKVEQREIIWNNIRETSYVIKTLTPYTTYLFWVRAETSAGVGNKSITSVTTEEGGNSLCLSHLKYTLK